VQDVLLRLRRPESFGVLQDSSNIEAINDDLALAVQAASALLPRLAGAGVAVHRYKHQRLKDLARLLDGTHWTNEVGMIKF
jgi:hypothetical protein